MAPFKRKHDSLEDSDDEEASFGRQILPVANLPEDFSGVPEDGLQYLFTVRRDARYLPHVTRVPNPYEITERPPVPSPKGRTSGSHPALPSEEWCLLFETRFKNFRKNINQPTIHVDAPNIERRRLIPDKKERDLWWAFLAGKPESEWNPPKKPKKPIQNGLKRQFHHGMRGWGDDALGDSREESPAETLYANDEGEVAQVLRVDPADSLPTPFGTPAPSEIFGEPCRAAPCSAVVSESPFVLPREPSTAILKLIDERMALHLLMYFTHWINLHLQQPEPPNHLITESHARWMFVLLSRIDDHISADDMSLLRNLARACLALLKISIQEQTLSLPLRPGQITSTIDKHPMGGRSCWVIIWTIVSMWKQRDLWIDAEDMLTSIGRS